MDVHEQVAIPEQVATPADLAATALAVGMYSTFGDVAPHGWSRVRDGVVAMVTGCPVPMLNPVLCARRGAGGAVALLVEEVATTGLPYCIQIRDGDPVAEEVARSRGLVATERVPLMLVDAAAVREPAGGAAIRVLRADESAVHVDALAAGFEAPAAAFAPLRESALLADGRVRAYVVEADGSPVATALGFTVGSHVGVFDVATTPAYRGRGYGAALTARAVADGAAAGARTALLQSSEMGLRVYERLGFRTVEYWTVWVAT